MSNILKNISNIDRRVWYFFVFFLVIIPLLNPIGLPLKVSAYTKEAYQTIEDLQPGDVVLVNFNIASSGWDEIKGSCYSIIPHLFSRPGVKIIMMTDQDQGYIYIQKTLEDRGSVMPGHDTFPWYQLNGKEYLVDYVNIGYFPGSDKAHAALAADFRGNVNDRDFYGNNIAQWLDDAGVQSAKDIDLIITLDCGGAVSYFVNYYYLEYGTPILNAMIGVSAAGSITSYNAGQIKALVMSVRGAAEYQYISGYYGMALVSMDAFSIVQMFLIAMVLLTNIAYWLSRRSGGGK
jgi:hypothetical protein